MTLIYCLTILMIFPMSSWTFSCHYNDSAIVLRKTVLLELEDHNYIRIYNAMFDIKPKNDTSKFSGELVNRNLHLIEDISFKGTLAEGDDSEYIEVTLNNLKSYRTKIQDNKCRVSYDEAKSEGLNITSEQETAIIRLAESCIQSRVCGFDLLEIDRDSDLYYQSTQSSLNEVVDYYVPKLLDQLVEKDRSIRIPTVNVSDTDFSIYFQNATIEGIDTIQRTNDVVIKHEKSKYNVSLIARFAEMNVTLYDLKARYKLLKTSGNLKIMLQGISLKTNVIIELQPSTCKITLDNTEMVAFKKIKLHIPVWGWFNTSYNMDSTKLWFHERKILSLIIQSIPQFNLGCKQYLDELSELL